MKKQNQIFITIAILLLGFSAYLLMRPVEYVAPNAPTVEIKEVLKQEDVLQSRIKQAQEAKKNDIEVEAQKAKDASIKQANLEIELEVTTAFRKEIEAKEKTLREQSVAY